MTFELHGPGDEDYDRLMDQFANDFGIERNIEAEEKMVEEIRSNPDAMKVLEDMTKIFEGVLGDSLATDDFAQASVAGVKDTIYGKEMEDSLMQTAAEVMTSEAEQFLKEQE